MKILTSTDRFAQTVREKYPKTNNESYRTPIVDITTQCLNPSQHSFSTTSKSVSYPCTAYHTLHESIGLIPILPFTTSISVPFQYGSFLALDPGPSFFSTDSSGSLLLFFRQGFVLLFLKSILPFSKLFRFREELGFLGIHLRW